VELLLLITVIEILKVKHYDIRDKESLEKKLWIVRMDSRCVVYDVI